MNTRTATEADLDALVQLFDQYRTFYEESSDPDAARAFLTERLQRRESHIICATDGERIVGLAQLYPSFSSVSMQPIWILNDLFVDPGCRSGSAGRGPYARQTDQRHPHRTEHGQTQHTAQKLNETNGWQRDDEY